MSLVRKIAVVGRDADLWLSALTLHRALAPAGIRVEAIELPSRLSPHDFYSAAPSLSGMHELLGLQRDDVLKTCSGMTAIGQRFSGWSLAPMFYGYDAVRPAIDDVDIVQYWARACLEGFAFPLERLSTAASAAAAGAFPIGEQDPREFGSVYSGYHLHARAYAGAMRSLASARGIAVQRSASVQVDWADDQITSLKLDDGTPVSADLFVDASGSEAELLGPLDDGWEDWSRSIPIDRLVVTSAPPLKRPPPFADIRALTNGWLGLFPLVDRTAIVGGFSSSIVTYEDFVREMTDAAGTTHIASPIVREFSAGMRRPWLGNCVRIGASAVSLPPLDLMQLHFAHVGVTNLIAWLPANTQDAESAASYNDVVRRYAENVRDFQIAHHLLNNRVGQRFWDQCRSATAPPSLQQRLDLFQARGLIPVFDEETFDDGLWIASFAGHGLVPRSFDPRVRRLSHEAVAPRLGRLQEVIARKVGAMRPAAESVTS